MSPPEDTTSITTRAQSLAVAPGTDDPTHSYLTYRSPLLNSSLPDNQTPEDPLLHHPPRFHPDAAAVGLSCLRARGFPVLLRFVHRYDTGNVGNDIVSIEHYV
ncbi:uncharacterized protein H6S33_007381 [Morchella sextelata]|uniref:uncharacterized protein n=1 Tax=Morchella sextelata TaxID=1174677 RepID=UPI001D03EB9C|nr:uncharacterized protein H6S33_007381 [Morchella sextelata]KAH0603722.1 hypothetical protein H6S33_007381 [Morchella sextelata]